MPSSKKIPLLAVFSMAFILIVWGIASPIMAIALKQHLIGPFDLAAWRTSLGSLLLFLVMALTGRPMRMPRPRLTILLGLLQTGVYTALYSESLVSGGAGKVTVLIYLMPVWVLLFSWIFLKERLAGGQWVSMLLAVAGVVLIIEPWTMAGSMTSKLLAVLSSVFWGSGVVISKQIQADEKVDAMSLTAWQMFIGSLVLIGLAQFAHEPATRWTPYMLWAMAFSVVLVSAVAWLMWVWLLRIFKASAAAIGSLAIPVVAVISSAWSMGEIPDRAELGGIALILTGLALLAVPGLRAQRLAARGR